MITLIKKINKKISCHILYRPKIIHYFCSLVCFHVYNTNVSYSWKMLTHMEDGCYRKQKQKNIKGILSGDRRKDVPKRIHLCDPVMLNVAPDGGMKIPSCLRRCQAQMVKKTQKPRLLDSPARWRQLGSRYIVLSNMTVGRKNSLKVLLKIMALQWGSAVCTGGTQQGQAKTSP